MAKVRKHVIVKGRVQGVWFRATTQEQAFAYGVTGWVRNVWNGNVEAVFEGDVKDVERVIQWCHNGPPYARVKEVEVEAEEYTGEFSTFSVR